MWNLGGHEPGATEPLVFDDHEGAVQGAAFAPGGARILTYSDDGTARLWDVADPSRPAVLPGSERKMTGAVFNSAGTRVLTLSEDQSLRLWDATGLPGRSVGQPAVLAKPAGAVAAVAFHADRPRIVTLSQRQGVRVWSFDPQGRDAGQPIVPPIDGDETLHGAAFGAGGVRLLAWSTTTVWIWSFDGPQGRRVSEPVILEQDDLVMRAALSAGASRVLTLSLGTARIYDLAAEPSDQLRGEPIVLRRYLGTAGLDAGGQWLATGDSDGVVRIWPLSVEGLREALRAVSSACLEVELRVRSLGEPREAAERIHAECERRHGRMPPAME